MIAQIGIFGKKWPVAVGADEIFEVYALRAVLAVVAIPGETLSKR